MWNSTPTHNKRVMPSLYKNTETLSSNNIRVGWICNDFEWGLNQRLRIPWNLWNNRMLFHTMELIQNVASRETNESIEIFVQIEQLIVLDLTSPSSVLINQKDWTSHENKRFYLENFIVTRQFKSHRKKCVLQAFQVWFITYKKIFRPKVVGLIFSFFLGRNMIRFR